MIKVQINSIEKDLSFDPGLSDTACRVGIRLDSANYELLKTEGAIKQERIRRRRLADGSEQLVRTGEVEAKIFCESEIPKPFGPKIKIWILDGGPNAPESLGYCFFKAFTGFRLLWEFDKDELCLERLS